MTETPETTEVEMKVELSPEADSAPVEDTANEEEGMKAVKKYCYWSLAAGVLPTMVDLAGLAALHQKLIHRLANIYGVKYSDQLAKNAVSGLVGVGLAGGGATLLKSCLKLLPGIGLISGVASMSVMAGATTYALGRVFIQHFETGGTLLTFDADKIRAFYEEELNAGKTVSQRLSWAGVKP